MMASVPFQICFLNIQNLHLSKDRNDKLTLIDWLLSNYRREGWIRQFRDKTARTFYWDVEHSDLENDENIKFVFGEKFG